MHKDYTAKIAHLKQVAVQHRNGPRGVEAQLELEEIHREIADAEAADRHREAIREAQASRRLDKWAFGVAFVALLVGGAGLWRSFLPSEPEHLSPASVSSEPAGRADPIHGIASKIPTPATTPAPPLPVPSLDKKPKALPAPPKE